ncbi:MAG: hypothetical protein U5K56_17775 [Halioglobus sp.]|nr:hypothetical protein [Halioglobus sp.]
MSRFASTNCRSILALSTIATALAMPVDSNAASQFADMRTWELQGPVDGSGNVEGNWVDPDDISTPFPDAASGRTVFQTENITAGTVFLLSNDDNVINRTFTGTIRTDDADDDWMGFVMGYINEDGDTFPEEYIGFNWSQGAPPLFAARGG